MGWNAPTSEKSKWMGRESEREKHEDLGEVGKELWAMAF
jgi:hypothetical protein